MKRGRSAVRNERPLAPIPLTIRDIMVGRVAAHAEAFERRWHLSSLPRVDAELADRFERQTKQWHDALSGPDDYQVQHESEAMIRAWDAIIIAMERASIAHEAYFIGYDRKGVPRVAIAEVGMEVPSMPGVTVMTPNEIVEVVDRLGAVVRAVKAEWPNAEIIEIREPTI